ncbi:hypothetical protein PR003_g12509 [Phytophthora rubi]|uniref:Uncharacterized protein n=1 Tax=Phytophthora rubi TaxID=129364 RepID=A0A6A4F4W1_9STRA|nr:hypothetical protein PR002_g11776 [Phytophthora rubi]KAE9336424.1 hypothetical protein PR003_g12509 [Phytophthora rubi]
MPDFWGPVRSWFLRRCLGLGINALGNSQRRPSTSGVSGFTSKFTYARKIGSSCYANQSSAPRAPTTQHSSANQALAPLGANTRSSSWRSSLMLRGTRAGHPPWESSFHWCSPLLKCPHGAAAAGTTEVAP